MTGPMEKLELDARPRDVVGRRVTQLRRHGEVPAVLYGHQQASVPVSIDAKALERIWHRAGRSHLVDLRLDGGRARKVLIREYQHNPRSAAPVHVDFFAVNLREKIAVDIPVVVTGGRGAEDRAAAAAPHHAPHRMPSRQAPGAAHRRRQRAHRDRPEHHHRADRPARRGDPRPRSRRRGRREPGGRQGRAAARARGDRRGRGSAGGRSRSRRRRGRRRTTGGRVAGATLIVLH